MKCYRCNGTGYYDIDNECPVCNGTGEYKPFDADVELDKLYPPEQTNEEWLRSCTTEQLADVISHLVFGGDFKKHISEMGYINMHSYKTEIVKWLKQPHITGGTK